MYAVSKKKRRLNGDTDTAGPLAPARIVVGAPPVSAELRAQATERILKAVRAAAGAEAAEEYTLRSIAKASRSISSEWSVRPKKAILIKMGKVQTEQRRAAMGGVNDWRCHSALYLS